MGSFFSLPAAGAAFFFCAWLLMIFAGIVHDEVGIRPFGYVTSMVVTHQIPDALKIGTSFLVLGNGKVAFDGSAEELARSDTPFVVSFLEPFKKTLRASFQSLHQELNNHEQESNA